MHLHGIQKHNVSDLTLWPELYSMDKNTPFKDRRQYVTKTLLYTLEKL